MTEIDRINAAIAAGQTVTGEAIGSNRKHQPSRGATVRVSQVLEDKWGGEYAVYSHSYKGRIYVRHLSVSGGETAEQCKAEAGY